MSAPRSLAASNRSTNFIVLVAGDAGDRRLARDIGAGEGLDHLLAELRLVIEHVMGDAEPGGDVARVVDVLAGAAGALAVGRRAVVIELHRHADDVVAVARQQRRGDARIDAARHRDDDARVLGGLGQAEAIEGTRRRVPGKRRGQHRSVQSQCGTIGPIASEGRRGPEKVAPARRRRRIGRKTPQIETLCKELAPDGLRQILSHDH